MFLLKKGIFNSTFIAKMSQNIKRAQRVQEGIQMNKFTIEKQAKLRQKLTVQSSIESMEKEMRQEIARSLKNSQNKVVYMINKAQNRLKEIQNRKRTSQEVKQYNDLVVLCEKARWQFMVHRQACGFTINNHQLVTSYYKIPPKLEA